MYTTSLLIANFWMDHIHEILSPGMVIAILFVGFVLWYNITHETIETVVKHYVVTYDPDGKGRTIKGNFLSYDVVKTYRGELSGIGSYGSQYIEHYHLKDMNGEYLILPMHRVVEIHRVIEKNDPKIKSSNTKVKS